MSLLNLVLLNLIFYVYKYRKQKYKKQNKYFRIVHIQKVHINFLINLMNFSTNRENGKKFQTTKILELQCA